MLSTLCIVGKLESLSLVSKCQGSVARIVLDLESEATWGNILPLDFFHVVKPQKPILPLFCQFAKIEKHIEVGTGSHYFSRRSWCTQQRMSLMIPTAFLARICTKCHIVTIKMSLRPYKLFQ